MHAYADRSYANPPTPWGHQACGNLVSPPVVLPPAFPELVPGGYSPFPHLRGGPSLQPFLTTCVQYIDFGHNLQHMAPFGMPTTGFCMLFQHATLILSTPGPIFGARDLDLGSGWAGDHFAPNMGPNKT